MKRALSVVLAMLMILSCLVILPTVAAEDTASSENKVILSNCDSYDGWPGFEGKGGTVDTTNKTEGTGSISINVAGKSVSGAGRFAYEWSKGTELNISAMKRVVFDFYVSDVAFLDTKFELEFRVKATCAHSSNHCDCNELHVSAKQLKEYVVGNPAAGWNRIEIPMSEFGQAGTVDKTKITYMRMFMPANSNTAFGEDGKNYTIKLDNFHFTDRQTAYEPVEGFDVVITNSDTNNGWNDNTVEGGNATGRPAYKLVEVEGRDGVMQTEYTGTLYANGGWSGPNGNGKFPTYGMQIQYKGAATNVTGMKYFCFWLYVSDPSALESTRVFLELFSNNIDNEEISAALTFADMNGKALTKGWNYISVDLAKLTDKVGTFRPEGFVGFRFFNADKLDLGSKKLTIAFDTVGFAKEKYTVTAPDAYIPVPASLISVIDGESLDGFATSDQLYLDYTDPYQGNSSIARTITGVDSSIAGIKYEFVMPNGKTYDATEIQRVCFDLYVSSVAAFENAAFEFELRGAGDTDTSELNAVRTLAELKGEALVDGWNHFDIALNTLGNYGKANMAAYNYFRIFLRGDLGAAGIEGETSTIKLDNVYMTAAPKTYEDRIPLIMSPNGNASSGKLSPSWGSGSYMVQFVNYRENPVDITKMTWIEFDVLIGDARMNNQKFRIDITSTGGSDNGQITAANRSLSQLTGTTVPVGEWTHVRIPLNVFNSATAASGSNVALNPAKVNYIRFFNQATDAGDTASYGFQVRNFAFTKDLSADTEFYIWDAESTAQFEGGAADAIVASKGVGFADVDGDGDKEYVLRNFAATDATKKIGTGNEQIVLNFKNDAHRLEGVGYADMTALRFDLYVSNEVYLNATLNTEWASAGGCDQSEISGNLALKNLIVEDKGNGWYTLEIKKSSLGSVTNGKHAPFMASRFNFMRMYTASVIEWGADEDLVVAVDNFYLIREGVAAEDENAFEIPAGALMLPISNKPIVNLAAGGSYAGTGSSQNAQGFAATDLSGYNMIFAELELQNYSEFADAVWCVELTSSGRCDANEYSTSKPLRTIFTRVDGQALQDGKQWVYMDLNSSIWANQGGTPDFTKINYIRIFNQTKPINVSAKSVALLSNFFAVNDETLDLSTANSVDFTGVSVNLNESLTMTFAANVHPSLSEVTMTVSLGDRDYQLEGTRLGATSRMLFTFDGIMPYQMGETITASLMAMTADGRLLTDSIENYSVKQYCMNLLDALESGELYDGTRALSSLLTEVLYYGAAVLNYNGEDASELLEGVDLTNRNTFYSTAKCAGLVGEQGDCPVAFDAVSAVLGSSYALRLSFAADAMDDMVLLVSDGQEVKEITEFKAGENAGEFYVDIPVSAFRIDDAYTFSFKGYEGYSLNYSFGTYIAARTAELDSTDAEYVLLDAIVAYSAASRAYVEAVR